MSSIRMLSTVEFEPFGGGTEVRWKMPAEGPLLHFLLVRVCQAMARFGIELDEALDRVTALLSDPDAADVT